MRQYTLDHLSDAALLRELSGLVARDRSTTADLLAHIAEVDERRLYAGLGYPSMFAYCVEDLHLSEVSAGKRIHAARAARKFPALLGALEEGRIHLTAICLLAPHVTEENIESLIAAATHKGKAEIEEWLVVHAMRPPVRLQPCSIKPIAVRAPENGPDVEPSIFASAGASHPAPTEHDLDHVEGSRILSGTHAAAHADDSKSTSHASPEHYRMQVTIPKGTHDKLRYAQDLLSHAVAPGDVAQVLDRALDLLIRRLESRRFGIPGRRHAPERH
jgi:hypothetical protein